LLFQSKAGKPEETFATDEMETVKYSF